MRVKNYEDFLKEEIGFRSALVGGAIGAGSILSNPVSASEPVRPSVNSDSLSVSEVGFSEQVKDTTDFVKHLETEMPYLFTDEDMSASTRIEFGKFEKLSFLRGKVKDFELDNEVKLNLDILSNPSSGVPFRINFFYIRGLDDVDNGALLIRIINVDFTTALNLAGHDVLFNFTRISGVSTLGARINF